MLQFPQKQQAWRDKKSFTKLANLTNDFIVLNIQHPYDVDFSMVIKGKNTKKFWKQLHIDYHLTLGIFIAGANTLNAIILPNLLEKRLTKMLVFQEAIALSYSSIFSMSSRNGMSFENK